MHRNASARLVLRRLKEVQAGFRKSTARLGGAAVLLVIINAVTGGALGGPPAPCTVQVARSATVV